MFRVKVLGWYKDLFPWAEFVPQNEVSSIPLELISFLAGAPSSALTIIPLYLMGGNGFCSSKAERVENRSVNYLPLSALIGRMDWGRETHPIFTLLSAFLLARMSSGMWLTSGRIIEFSSGRRRGSRTQLEMEPPSANPLPLPHLINLLKCSEGGREHSTARWIL
jgi:hypothetical protein